MPKFLELDKSKHSVKRYSPSLHGVQAKRYDPVQRIYYKFDSSPATLQGLTEFVVSQILDSCSVNGVVVSHVRYSLYREGELTGTSSPNFLELGEKEVPVSTILSGATTVNFQQIEQMAPQEKFDIVSDVCQKVTGVPDISLFFGVQLLLDYLFVNEDRHWSNISFIRGTDGVYRCAPYFDFAESYRSFHVDKVQDSWLHFEPQPYTQDQLECLDTLLHGSHLVFDAARWSKQRETRVAQVEQVYSELELNSVEQKFLTALWSFPRKDLVEVI